MDPAITIGDASLPLSALAAAFGGGALAAAIGALPAFIFTGFAVIAGAAVVAGGGGPGVLQNVAFGPIFGPHVSFAGGVAAAAYAARRGLLDSGRQITAPLLVLNRLDVILVGGLFGAGGSLAVLVLDGVGLGRWTDSIALTVVLSACLARLLFGRTGLFGTVRDGAVRFQPSEAANWVRWQESPLQLVAIGLAMGLASSYVALTLPGAGGHVMMFGVAAALLLFGQVGEKMPVTHHIALPAALAAASTGNLLVGVAFGLAGAFAGELFARLFLIHGDTHIDPPATAIALTICALRLGEALF